MTRRSLERSMFATTWTLGTYERNAPRREQRISYGRKALKLVAEETAARQAKTARLKAIREEMHNV
jgi:hypothetical protein